MYKIVYLDSIEKDLKKLDKNTITQILNKIENYLAKNPKTLGKALTGEFKGFYRYRFGDYRVIYRISQTEILITIFRIGHRKHIYK